MFEKQKIREGLGLAGLSLVASLILSGAGLAQDAGGGADGSVGSGEVIFVVDPICADCIDNGIVPVEGTYVDNGTYEDVFIYVDDGIYLNDVIHYAEVIAVDEDEAINCS